MKTTPGYWRPTPVSYTHLDVYKRQFLGYEAAKQQRSYKNGEGIVHESVEGTIDSIGRIASKGMYSTDIEILNIMLEN